LGLKADFPSLLTALGSAFECNCDLSFEIIGLAQGSFVAIPGFMGRLFRSKSFLFFELTP
jgi:hypothetical protein